MISKLMLLVVLASDFNLVDRLLIRWEEYKEQFRAAPTVTRIYLFPDKIQLAVGEHSERLCVFVRVSTGRIGLRTQDLGTTCETLYRYQYVKSTRRLTSTEQALVDRTCIDFKVTGGTMYPAGCDRVVP